MFRFTKMQRNREIFWKVLFWVLTFLKPYKKYLITLLICMFLISGIELLVPRLIQHFIDYILPSKDWDASYALIVTISIMVVVMIMIGNAQNYIQRTYQEKVSKDFQLYLFGHLRKLGFSFYERQSVGETLALLNSEIHQTLGIYRFFLPWMMHAFVFSSLAVTFMFTASCSWL